MNHKSKVSIIIPTYNNKKYIGAAVASALNQTYHNIEVIIVNDNSTDNTENVIREFKDPRITYLKLDANQGVSNARNIGIKQSTGEYIAFLDSDDMYLETKIEEQINIFKTSQVSDIGVVYCGFKTIDERDVVLKEVFAKGKKWDGITNGEFIGATPLIKRECFKKAGLFDTNLKYFEDMDLYFRIYENKYSFACIRKPLYLCRSHSSNTSRNKKIVIENIDVYYKKYLATPEYKNNKIIKSQYYAAKSITLIKANIITSMYYMILSFLCSPFASLYTFKKLIMNYLNRI
jgi:glycosyltransferase involved in cell wall biosynthesis